MLKGIAHAGDGSPEDKYGIVVGLSQLSDSLTQAESDSAFVAAAETGTALLHASAVFVLVGNLSRLEISGRTGDASSRQTVELAKHVAGLALETGNPVVHPAVGSESSPLAGKLTAAGMASVLAVPMLVGESTVGAMVAFSREPRVFSSSDTMLLHVVASHAALAAWHSRGTSTNPAQTAEQDELIRDAERKIRELSLLNRVSDAMSSTLNLDDLLDIALEQSLAVVGADAGSLMLINEDTSRLEIVASRGIPRQFVETTSQQVGTSIAGWVAQHGEAVLVTDAAKDGRFAMPFVRGSITCSVSVPLKSKGTVIGVLNVNTRQADKTFDERDIGLLTTVANQMAVAIENARLYARVNRRTKQLDSLLQISRTITSTLNLDEVLRRLSDEICSLFQLDVCVVLLVDELSGRSRFGYGTGLKTRKKYVYYDLAAPLAARVKQTGRRVLVRDLASSSSLKSEISDTEGLHGAIGIPLKDEGRLVGIAAGFSREAKLFPRSQRDISRSLGDLAGVAIRNARVYRQKYRIAEMLQQRLIPSSIPTVKGVDIGHNFMPAREVGGDYYDFIHRGDGGFCVVMADVSGSDVEAAEYTTMGKHVLRTYAREFASPAEVLTKTNDLICEDTSAEVFISLFYGAIDLISKRLIYANAGCEPPILYKKKDAKATALTTDGILLGIRSGSTFEERQVELSRGDVLVLYTDGLTEASVDGKMLGAQAVMDTVAENAHLSAQGIADRIRDVLIEYVHGRITDDVAMVVLKIG